VPWVVKQVNRILVPDRTPLRTKQFKQERSIPPLDMNLLFLMDVSDHQLWLRVKSLSCNRISCKSFAVPGHIRT
jgi:hypothetical protein